ncbi:MAG: DUF4147 domain-containing protein [Planctomycetaceae bacterium]|nr:DUF4147 domain-containing protein [Planctomycetaceae bacterium]
MTNQLRKDGLQIWNRGVTAVDSEQLVLDNVKVDHQLLTIGRQTWPLDQLRRIVVVGAGKAGAGMARGLEKAFGKQTLEEKHVSGWINVPADCVQSLQRIHLHAARPAGRNEPTREGMQGTQRILDLVRGLGPQDLCLCLISGGGSALLPAPINGISFDDKLRVTRHLSESGANIQQLNAVRSSLSAIKGGGLARACQAGRLVTLVISDVMGDPLETIASGPTIVNFDPAQRAAIALQVLDEFDVASCGASANLAHIIRQHAANQPTTAAPQITNLVIGNNRTATRAAEQEASRLGYRVILLPSESATSSAEEVGSSLVHAMLERLETGIKTCWISGGEPIVKLIDPSTRGRGGRNQQLVVAGLLQLIKSNTRTPVLNQQLLLSGGTDGEDGPTDAAGGLVDEDVARQMIVRQLDAADYLHRNDTYSFLQQTGGLIRTGPTHTNVCDIRVALMDGSIDRP